MMIPLWARATESRKPRPMLFDPRAIELCDNVGFDFSFLRRAYGTRVGCVVRTMLFDAWVSDFLASYPRGTVVELGAGLSTRFERLDNGEASWVDVDLPDAIALRRAHSTPSPRRTFVACSVVEHDWIARVLDRGRKPVYVVCEGMLMYLRPEDVRGLLVRIADAFAPCEVALDSIAPAVVRHQRLHDSMRHMMDAPFRWGVRDAREVETWDDRLRVRDVYTLPEIVRRFADRIGWTHRISAELVDRLAPGLAQSYRLSRIAVGRTQARL